MQTPIRALLLLFSLCLALPVQAEIDSLASAINKAGRQRMLTQRMVKAYCMLGIDVKTEVARQQLHDTIRQFESQLAELKAFAPNAKVGDALDKVEQLWLPFKTTLTAPVSRANAERLMADNDALLAAAHRVVLILQDLSDTAVGRLVNVSGRQRMLSQRLGKFYMLRAWGFDNSEVRFEMDQARSEFKGALAQLMEAPENSAGIRSALEEAGRQWSLFEHALDRNNKELVPLIVAMTSEQLLVKMNEITAMYEGLSAR